MTVAAIAMEVGYKNATHFTAAFKKYFGYLPSDVKNNS
jgi:AraC-like DNA-binding protein